MSNEERSEDLSRIHQDSHAVADESSIDQHGMACLKHHNRIRQPFPFFSPRNIFPEISDLSKGQTGNLHYHHHVVVSKFAEADALTSVDPWQQTPWKLCHDSIRLPPTCLQHASITAALNLQGTTRPLRAACSHVQSTMRGAPLRIWPCDAATSHEPLLDGQGRSTHLGVRRCSPTHSCGRLG